MALNPEFIGRNYPTTNSFLVGREQIRAFAASIGESSLISFDSLTAQQAGYADIVAPPTFAIILSLVASERVAKDPELGLDYHRVVHAEQKFEYQRPIVAGDELLVDTKIENIRTIVGNDIITTVAEIKTLAGELVCEARSTLLSRGVE